MRLTNTIRRGSPLVTAGSVGGIAAALLALLLVPPLLRDGNPSTRVAATGSPTPAPVVSPGGPSSGSPGGSTRTGGTVAGPSVAPPPTQLVVDPSTGPHATLVIGVAVPDLSFVRSLGPAYDMGPIDKQFEAALAAYRSSHRLPIAGRDIRFVFRTFNVLDDSDQRRVCTQLVDDDHAFAVVAYFLFLAGGKCTAGEKHVPTINVDPLAQADLAGAAPYLYSVAPELGRVLRQQVDWMIDSGLVRGHRVGLYYPSTPDTTAAVVRDQFIARLKARGYQLAAEVTTSDGTAGGPTDAIAVRRFQSARVDVAVLLVGPLSKANFLQSAQTQQYFPTQVTSDFALDTTTAVAATYPARAFDGAWGLTSYRAGEIENGYVAPRARSCLKHYTTYTGRPQPSPSGGELPSTLGVCDAVDVLLSALEHAGPDISRPTLLSGLQHVSLDELSGVSKASFGPGKYGGLDRARTVRWHRDCACWKAVGSFTEMVP